MRTAAAPLPRGIEGLGGGGRVGGPCRVVGHTLVLGITEVPNYRAFNPTYTELKIHAELMPKLRLSAKEMLN